MSGGVDSSVAAALLLEQGHEVVGTTLKLWDGPGDRGCCSVADVEDARRVAQQLGIAHHVFNFTEDFDRHVVTPYVSAHAVGLTPNPCIECNRHLKFDRLLRRAVDLGFDALATGHHVRVVREDGRPSLMRAKDLAKDQSYVLYMLGRSDLERCLFPIGSLSKAQVRARAAELGLRTATKPDSQDVCFLGGAGGREAFVGARIPLHPGRVVDRDGIDRGHVDSVELVTVGQRRGLGGGGGERRYALAIDPDRRIVTVGCEQDLSTDRMRLVDMCWVNGPVAGPVSVQSSAHGAARDATFEGDVVTFAEPQKRVAPGQSVVLYRGDVVLGGGVAIRD
jgi:tRNA-specific 2-thiouridylase